VNILVTGSAGYVGSVCAAELVNQKHRVIGYDNLSAGHREALVRGVKFIQGDLADTRRLKRVCKRNRIEGVMHFAATTLVAESMSNPHLFYQNNVTATIALLEVLLECKIRRMVFSSSAAVYGDPQRTPIREEHPTLPVNPYGESKLAVERALAWYHRAYGLNCVALRYFNAAGATDRLGEDHRPETHLLPRLLEAAMNPDKGFSIYGEDYPTPDGTCVRDFIHVRDIAHAHILALQFFTNVYFRTYNVGHGKGYSVREVIKTVEEVTGRRLAISVGPRRPGDPAVLVASPRKICRELTWYPRWSDLKTIVTSAWAWKLRHPCGYASRLNNQYSL